MSNKSGHYRHKAIFDAIKNNIRSSKLITRLLSNCSQSQGGGINQMETEHTMTATNAFPLNNSSQQTSMDLQTCQYAHNGANAMPPMTPTLQTGERHVLSSPQE